MDRINKIIVYFFLPALLLTFMSCQDKQSEEVNYLTLAEDATITENVFRDIFRVIDDESKNGQYHGQIGKNSWKSHIDTCAIVILNTNGGNFPMSLTIDFGSGCTDAYNVTRKGKLVATYSKAYRDSGSVVTITTEDYYVNDFKVDGTEIIRNNGRNNSGNLEFSVAISNGVITKPDGGMITWISERTNEWIAGENTTFITSGLNGICDDVYNISGYGEGITSDGQSYRIDIVDPLEKQICCRWVVSGSLSVSVNGSSIATLDYGNGACVPNANLTYGNNTVMIVII